MLGGIRVLVVFLVVAGLQPVSASNAQDMSASKNRSTPWSDGMRLAQNRDCDEARANANTCYTNWRNIGGGTSGQAGAFYQCWKNYCVLLAGHACNTPSFCSQ